MEHYLKGRRHGNDVAVIGTNSMLRFDLHQNGGVIVRIKTSSPIPTQSDETNGSRITFLQACDGLKSLGSSFQMLGLISSKQDKRQYLDVC